MGLSLKPIPTLASPPFEGERNRVARMSYCKLRPMPEGERENVQTAFSTTC